MPVLKVTDENFEEMIGNKDKPVLVKFGAEWCGPCKMVTPVLNELADEMSDQIVIGDHDIDNSPNAPTKFGVRGVPTMLLFKGGEVVDSKLERLQKKILKLGLILRLDNDSKLGILI